MAEILILHYELKLCQAFSSLLRQHAHHPKLANSVTLALEYITKKHFDLLVLDRSLPDGDGLEVVDYLQQTLIDTPTLVISRRCEVEDRIQGFKRGVDEYMSVPFSFDEFLLRAESLLAKTKHPRLPHLQVGEVMLFPDTGEVMHRKQRVYLRPKEFEILNFLVKHRNYVVTHQMFVDNIWLDKEAPSRTTIAVYIRRIRYLLSTIQLPLIKTLRGFGYMVTPPVTPAVTL